MIFWLIIFFIGGTIFGFGLSYILNNNKVSNLYEEIHKLKLKIKSNEEAIRNLKNRENNYPTYTTYSSKF